MNLTIVEGAGIKARSTREPNTAPRLRPGDDGRYMTLSLDADSRNRLRQAAGEIGVSVDALFSTTVEMLDCERLLHTAGVSQQPLTASPGPTSVTQLAPTSALRCWVTALTRGASAPVCDELPEVIVPERLVPRLRRVGEHEVLESACRRGAEAIRIEALAAGQGLTLTEHVLWNTLHRTRPRSA
jgi:hypothetical protein